VHPIDDEDAFPDDFGLDTAAGMMGLDAVAFGRGRRGGRGGGGGGRGGGGERRGAAAASTFEQERQAVLAQLKEWEPFDWTRQLDGGT